MAIRVSASPDTVVARQSPEGVFFDVTQRVVNSGDEKVFFETCPTTNLQRLDDREWKDAQSQVCSLIDLPPRALAPGAQLMLHHHFGGSSVAPAFAYADSVAGTYRLIFFVKRDSSRTARTYQATVSNPFVVRLP